MSTTPGIPATAQKIVNLMRVAIPQLAPILERAMALTATHLILILETKTSLLVPQMTDEEREHMAEGHSAHVVRITRVRELVALASTPEVVATFDRAMEMPRTPGNVMVLVTVDSALGFYVIRGGDPGQEHELIALPEGFTVPAPVYRADGRASLLSMLHAPVSEDLPEERRATLRRFVDLGRGIEAVEAAKTPPGNVGDALFEMFDGAALEAAIAAVDHRQAAQEGEEQVFQIFKAAVDRVYAQTASA